MIREDLVAERIAIETYHEMVSFFSQKDPTSRCLIEEILATEEEHADEFAKLLAKFDFSQCDSASGDDSLYAIFLEADNHTLGSFRH